ncbi:MAG TPA: hypothetical protein VFV86_06290 [Nitrososphaeraceae archaeon]|nr:hypothetical protein [Nitrososphaeraceae archaeon]
MNNNNNNTNSTVEEKVYQEGQVGSLGKTALIDSVSFIQDLTRPSGCISMCYCNECKIAYYSSICVCIKANWGTCDKCDKRLSFNPIDDVLYTEVKV